jgi:hypothetical protein
MNPLLLAMPVLAAVPTTATLPLLPENNSLVRGVVVAGKEARNYLVNEVRVEHVYHGSSKLVGQSFTVSSANSEDDVPSGNMYFVVPRLRPGDRGIWLLSKSADALRTVGWYNYMRWPALEVGGPAWAPPYETIKAFAEAVERSSQRRSTRDAIDALERLTTDANQYISSWAIQRLPVVSQGSRDVPKFLKALVADAHVPIQGQVALDRTLLGEADLEGISVERPNPGWQHSEARLNLFRRWFTGALSERDARLVASRLDRTAQHPAVIGFSPQDLMRLVTLLVENDRFPMSERQGAGRIIKWAASRYDTDEVTFDTAVDLLGRDLPDALRAALAAVFVNEFVMNDDRRQMLVKLREVEHAKSVIQFLDKALARPNGKPKRPFAFPGGPKRSEPFTGRTADDAK